MSTEEDVKFQRDLNDEIAKTAEAYSKLKESQADVLFFSRDYADEAKRAAKAVSGSTINASETAKAFRDVASAAKKISDNYAGVITGEKTFQDLKKESLALDAARSGFETEFDQFLRAQGAEGAKLVGNTQLMAQIRKGELDTLQVMEALGGDLTNENAELLDLYILQNEQLNDESANMAEIAERAGKIDDAMRPLGKSAISLQDMGDGLSKGLSSAGLGNLSGKLGIEDAITGARKTAASLTEGGSKALGMGDKLGIAGDMATTMGKNLMKSLGPAALIAMAIQQIVEAFKLIDGKSGELAKNFGVSAAEGRKMVASANDAATASGDLLVSTGDVVAAQMSLNKIFGSSVKFSGELASEFASVAERTGLSESAMGVFAKKAVAAGTTIKDQLKIVHATSMELSAQTGIMMNAKDIQEGIGEMSALQRLNNQNNTKEMAKQVFQAKMLGISQSQLASVSSSLLDFESSIGAEMEAELLTGKQLNLEEARRLALNNDMEGVAREMTKQGITQASFAGMNAIKQEALAKAFGMQKEDMAEMLLNEGKLQAVKEAGFKSTSDAQEQYNKALKEGNLTEALKNDLAEAGLLNQMESATMADKMAAAQDKIKDLFVKIMEPLMPILDVMMTIMEKAFKPLMPILSAVASLLGGIIGPVLETIFLPVQLAVDALGEFGDLFSDLLPEGTKMGDIFSTIGKILGTIMSVGLLPAQAVMRTIINSAQGLFKIFDGVKKMFTGDFFGGLKDVFGGLIDIVLSPFQAVFDIIVKGISMLVDAINFIPGIDIDFGFEMPKISSMLGLAEGGVVTGPTNALVGEGSEAEAVLPLSKLADMLPNGVAIGDAVLNAATAPMRGIMNTIGSIFDQGDIGDILKNPLEGIMDTVSGMFGSNDIGDSLIAAATAPMRGIMDVASNLFGNEPNEISSPEIGGSLLGGIGEVVSGLFGSSEPSPQSPQPQQENTNNAEMVALLKELIVTVKQGGDVYIDGAKAGRSMALATSKIG